MKTKQGFAHVILLLILVVVLAGAGFAGYYFLFMNKPTEKTVPPPMRNSAAVDLPLSLSVQSPADGILVEDKKLTVSGVTRPDSVVVMYTDEDQSSVQSGPDGKFSGQLALVDGINTLTVTAYGDNDEEKSVSMDVVYDKGT